MAVGGTEAAGQFPRSPFDRLGQVTHDALRFVGRNWVSVSVSTVVAAGLAGGYFLLSHGISQTAPVDNAPYSDTLKPPPEGGSNNNVSILNPPAESTPVREATPVPPTPTPEPSPTATSSPEPPPPPPKPEIQPKYAINSPVSAEDRKDLHIGGNGDQTAFFVKTKKSAVNLYAVEDGNLQPGNAGKDGKLVSRITITSSDGKIQVVYTFNGTISGDQIMPRPVKAGELIGTTAGFLPPAFTRPELNQGEGQHAATIAFNRVGVAPGPEAVIDVNQFQVS